MQLFALVIFFTLLVLIGCVDSWKKSLKIFGCFILLSLGIGLISSVFNLGDDVINVLELLLRGSFTVGLLLYCFMKGYIPHL